MFLFRDSALNIRTEIRAALKRIFGINWRKSNIIICKVGLGYPFFLRNLNTYFFAVISFLLKGLVLSDVRIKRLIILDIWELIDIRNYIGIRHMLFLPVHGQRTRSNARTQRSKRLPKLEDANLKQAKDKYKFNLKKKYGRRKNR